MSDNDWNNLICFCFAKPALSEVEGMDDDLEEAARRIGQCVCWR